MKQIKEDIIKIFEKNNINFLDYALNDYLEEEQQRHIREIIKEENTLNIEYREEEINTIINKYELYNIEDLKQIIKKHFSKYSTEDLKKQLFKKINLNLDNYSKEKYFNLYNLNLKDLTELYKKVMLNYNKEIVLNHYCKTYYNNKIEEYKTEEFKNNFEKYLSLIFPKDAENLKEYEINFYLNGKAKIRFKNKELHKQVYLFLTQETFKEITKEIFIKLNDYKEEFKPFVKRFTIYKTTDETEQIYINMKVNLFDYAKLQKQNIELAERPNLNLNCLIDLSICETTEDFYKERIENLFKEITEEQNKNKVLKFLEHIKR